MATITFNKNGGTGGTDSIDSTSPLTQISVPHKNGYNFIGYVDTVTDTMYYEGGGKLDTSLSTSSINNLTAQYIPMPVYIDTNFNCISANYGYYGETTTYESLDTECVTIIGDDNLYLSFDGEYNHSFNPFSYGKNYNADIFIDKDEWHENHCLCIGLVHEGGTFNLVGEVSLNVELLDGYGKNLNHKIIVPFPSGDTKYSHTLFSYSLKNSIITKYIRIRISLSVGNNNDYRFIADDYKIRPIVYFIPDTRYEITSLHSVTSRRDMPIGLVDITNNNINVIPVSDNEYNYPLKFTQSTHTESNSVNAKFRADRYKVADGSSNLTTLSDTITHIRQLLSNEGLDDTPYNNSFKLIQNWRLNQNTWFKSNVFIKLGGDWVSVIRPAIKEHINRLALSTPYVWALASQVLTHKQLGGYTYGELYDLDIPYNELTDTYKHYQGYTHDELSNSKHESIGELEE